MIKFIKVRNPDNEFELSNVEFSIDDNGLTVHQLLEEFHNFLKAISYQFNLKDEIILLREDEQVVVTEEDDDEIVEEDEEEDQPKPASLKDPYSFYREYLAMYKQKNCTDINI